MSYFSLCESSAEFRSNATLDVSTSIDSGTAKRKCLINRRYNGVHINKIGLKMPRER